MSCGGSEGQATDADVLDEAQFRTPTKLDRTVFPESDPENSDDSDGSYSKAPTKKKQRMDNDHQP